MTFSALLLTGGESRRMGKDKATLEFGGCPLWKRQLGTLRALAPERIFVSARTAPSWLPQGVELLLDDPPSRGPLSGLAKGLAATATTHLVVLAVDMPFMTVEGLRELLELVRENRGVVPVMPGRAEPLAAIYPKNAADDFNAALSTADFSLQHIVRKLAADARVTLWRVPDKRVDYYRSVNTPEEFNA